MAYEYVNPIKQFNFQINRVLTYGDAACCRQEVTESLSSVRTFAQWNQAWLTLVEKAEREKRWLHAAYYYRMTEFFMKADNPQKMQTYLKCIEYFYKGFDSELHLSYRKDEIPFEEGMLNSIVIPASDSKGTVLVCGGYDSFMEEFVLQVGTWAERGYTVILFEGPGQGICLHQNMYFRYDFEKPVSAVIDFYGLNRCAMIGISWGGYFALRSAAFEKRIAAAVAYDVMDNGFEVMTNIFPAPVSSLIRLAYRKQWAGIINAVTGLLYKKSILADWGLSQGTYITGTKTAYEFYQKLAEHNLNGITGHYTQDILLLAGEKDHYIPLGQFWRLKEKVHSDKSVTSRLFTEAEGGEQHCQIGNHMLAMNTILDWLDDVFADKK